MTEFGKELRKIRLDNDELLKNMADKLSVGSAYLSAIEHGKKVVPSTLIYRLRDLYGLAAEEVDKLSKLAKSNT